MKIFRFDREAGKNIESYNSSGLTISRVAHLFREAVIGCAYLSAGGTIGNHQAAIPQLFLVVRGKGWVRSEESERTSIKAGQAAYWEQGEWHESGTNSGMTVIIVEGVNFDPAELMSLA